MKKINLINIFKVFFKIGVILLGGGYVIVPIMKEELVEKNKWLNEDELLDFYCVSQCLPGIIAINMAILTGHKIYKFKGAITGLFAMSLSPILSIIIIAHLISEITSIPFMEGVFWGVNLSVIVLIYLALKEMWQKSMTDLFSFFWYIFILLLAILKVNPAFLIVISIISGLVCCFIKSLKENRHAD